MLRSGRSLRPEARNGRRACFETARAAPPQRGEVSAWPTWRSALAGTRSAIRPSTVPGRRPRRRSARNDLHQHAGRRGEDTSTATLSVSSSSTGSSIGDRVAHRLQPRARPRRWFPPAPEGRSGRRISPVSLIPGHRPRTPPVRRSWPRISVNRRQHREVQQRRRYAGWEHPAWSGGRRERRAIDEGLLGHHGGDFGAEAGGASDPRARPGSDGSDAPSASTASPVPRA